MEDFVQYLTTSPGTQLGPLSIAALLLLAGALVVGVWWRRRPSDNLLRRQVNRRLGTALAAAAFAEGILIVWRLLGFDDPRLIPYAGLLVVLFIVSYALWYVRFGLPRAEQVYTRYKERFEKGVVPSAVRAAASNVNPASTGWAEASGAAGAAVLYFAMYPSTDHALHWFMLFIGAALGYACGLTVIAGRGAAKLGQYAARGKRGGKSRRA